jgi:hypothetical protein
VQKKIFANYTSVKNRACIKLSDKNQDVFCSANKTIINAVDNKWGKKGWTLIELSKYHYILTTKIFSANF